jgi:hypothetical protein
MTDVCAHSDQAKKWEPPKGAVPPPRPARIRIKINKNLFHKFLFILV